jgi:branched-chain amino acid transport system substrate-binding protein
MQNPDFVPFVQRVKDAKPDVAFLWVPAQTQATAMMNAIRDLGLREVGIRIVSAQDLLPDEELPKMGDTPLGLITAGNYSTAADRPQNKATKGNFTGDQAMEFLSHWKNPDSPRGPIEIDPNTRDIVQNIYIREVKRVDGKLANVEIATIPRVKDPWKELNPPK